MPVLVLLLTCCVPLGKCLPLSEFPLSNKSGLLHLRHPRVLVWQVKGYVRSTSKQRETYNMEKETLTAVDCKDSSKLQSRHNKSQSKIQ